MKFFLVKNLKQRFKIWTATVTKKHALYLEFNNVQSSFTMGLRAKFNDCKSSEVENINLK